VCVGRGGDPVGCAAVQLGDQPQLLGVQDGDLPLGLAEPVYDLVVCNTLVLEHMFDSTPQPICQPPAHKSVDN
jgi:hypothetical protein